jgi:hypothetical protein
LLRIGGLGDVFEVLAHPVDARQAILLALTMSSQSARSITTAVVLGDDAIPDSGPVNAHPVALP